MASCRTYGGKPLVNASGSPSGSMHGTVALGLTSLINSDLTWKKVAKGNRSSSRRARNSVSRSFRISEELIDKDFNTVDMPVSESEKLGVSVLGCRFSEKVEHVPIKKRKFTFRSPSPPSRSLNTKKAERLLKRHVEAIDNCASTGDLGQIIDTEHVAGEKKLLSVNEQLDENEDFSGISILAAAACSSSFGGGDHRIEDGSGAEESFAHDGSSMHNESCSLSKRVLKEGRSSTEISTEGSGSCIFAVPAEELTASLGMGNSSSNSVPQENNLQNKSVQGYSMTISDDILAKEDEGTDRGLGASSRDDRLHWDLNTPMDAWEHPFDYQCAVSQTNTVDHSLEDVKDGNHSVKIGYSEGEDVRRNSVESRCCAEGEIQWDDYREIAHKEHMPNVEELKLDSYTEGDKPSCIQEKLSPSVNVDVISADNRSISFDEDANATAPFLTSKATENSGSLSASNVGVLDSCVDDTLPSKTIDSMGTSITDAIGDAASAGVNDVKNEDTCANTGREDTLASDLQVQEEVTPPLTLSSDTITQTQDISNEDAEGVKDLHDEHNPLQNSQQLKSGSIDDVRDEVGLPPSSPLGLERVTSISGTLIVDLKGQHENVPCNDISIDTGNNESEDPVTHSSEKTLLSSCLNASSGLSSCDARRTNTKDLVDNFDKASEDPFDNGYDSDVSLDGHAYVKLSRLELDYDSEYEDGEVRESIEHTWDGFDGEDMDAEHVDYRSDNTNLDLGMNQNMKSTAGMDFHPCPSSLIVNTASKEVENGDNIDKKPKEGANKVIRDGGITAGVNDISHMTVARNDSTRKNISCDIADELDAEGQMRMAESRAFRRELRSRIEGRTSDVVSFRKDSTGDDLNSRSEKDSGHAPARSRNDRWVDSPDSNRGARRHHSPNYYDSLSFRLSRRLTRSGSPDARDETCGMRIRIRSSRGFSPGRSVTLGRGRSIRYHMQVDGRGPRSRYHGLVSDRCAESSLNHSHPSTKRDRSFSPIERRRNSHIHRSHSKSPSKSRSRSPNFVNSCLRHRSKSPSFKSEHRMQRVRSPHQRPGLLADRMGGFRPVPRSHGSPPQYMRWMGDRKDGVVHFRAQSYNQRAFIDRRSPGRFGMRDDRFDMVDSPRNFRSMHPGRFTEMDGGVGRGGSRHEGSDDDRGKHGCRYGVVYPMKRYDMGDRKDGVVHFRAQCYNQRASFSDRRSPGRFGPRDDRFDMVDSPRSFRSMQPGRLTEMDGVGRGSLRHEGSDDDRGKHSYRYGLVYPVKRYGMDGPMKRFRYNVEDGFVAAHNSRCRDASDFHGRGSPKDHGRGSDNRIEDVPRKSREERAPFSYQREGKHNVHSKSFGLREGDDDIASRRRLS